MFLDLCRQEFSSASASTALTFFYDVGATQRLIVPWSRRRRNGDVHPRRRRLRRRQENDDAAFPAAAAAADLGPGPAGFG